MFLPYLLYIPTPICNLLLRGNPSFCPFSPAHGLPPAPLTLATKGFFCRSDRPPKDSVRHQRRLLTTYFVTTNRTTRGVVEHERLYSLAEVAKGELQLVFDPVWTKAQGISEDDIRAMKEDVKLAAQDRITWNEVWCWRLFVTFWHSSPQI